MPTTLNPKAAALDDAVTSAVGTMPDFTKPLPSEEPTTPVGEVEEEGEVEATPATEASALAGALDDFGLTPDQQKEAKRLFAGLGDPNKSKAIVKLLAEAQGYSLPETRTEVKETAKGMVEDMKEALGPELGYLADKMGPVFEKYLKSAVDEAKTEAKSSVDAITYKESIVESDLAISTLAKEYFADGKLPAKLEAEMAKLADSYKSDGSLGMKDYLEELLVLAGRRTKTTLTKIDPSRQKKIDRNRNDAPSRLASETRTQPAQGEPRAVHPRTQMTLEDAVRSAVAKASADLD